MRKFIITFFVSFFFFLSFSVEASTIQIKGDLPQNKPLFAPPVGVNALPYSGSGYTEEELKEGSNTPNLEELPVQTQNPDRNTAEEKAPNQDELPVGVFGGKTFFKVLFFSLLLVALAYVGYKLYQTHD